MRWRGASQSLSLQVLAELSKRASTERGQQAYAGSDTQSQFWDSGYDVWPQSVERCAELVRPVLCVHAAPPQQGIAATNNSSSCHWAAAVTELSVTEL